jgi:hypothetical protein
MTYYWDNWDMIDESLVADMPAVARANHIQRQKRMRRRMRSN